MKFDVYLRVWGGLWLVSVSQVSAQCQDDVFSRAQYCLVNSSVFTVANKFYYKPEEVVAFCSVSIQQIYDCLGQYEKLCVNSANQTTILQLLVDKQRLSDELNDYCKSIPDILNNTNCFADSVKKTACLRTATKTYVSMVKSDQTGSRRKTMDLACSYYRNMTQCFLETFPTPCGFQQAAYGEVFKALEYPYCSLSDSQKDVLFPPLGVRSADQTTAVTSGGLLVTSSLSGLLAVAALALLSSLACL